MSSEHKNSLFFETFASSFTFQRLLDVCCEFDDFYKQNEALPACLVNSNV
jgi:hypothetical protein